MDLCANIYLSRFSYIRWMYVHFVYFDICRGKYVLQVEYVRTYLRTCIYMLHATMCKYVQKTSVQQAELQQVSKKGNNHSSRVFNALTDAYAYVWWIRNICDVTYTVPEMRLRRAYLCLERVLMQRNHFAVTTVAPFISWIMIPLEEESLCSWKFYTNR